ncbi:hypothetical protein LO762_29595 [Actinocorallia sp. API 0066]|uniref:glycoside hydrolase family 113 n=1 Tax=Actinocorallia sp. API 0066 TaxID=2896846 RepID=UPI001E2A6531|nr:hypothetical protein [Actinocorallia sp. API 0066]MCD0453305.1 hypothetical protein [Actinocorallia sp. API 0066]
MTTARPASALAAALLLGAAACAAPHAAAPPRQYGFALPSWTETDYASPVAATHVASLAATGAGWIQLTPTWYQSDPAASAIGRTEETASDASLRHVVALARRHGLKILLKPHLDLPDDRDRAEIRPHDLAAWFTSYRAFLLHYARLAASLNIEEFAVGTELAGVQAHRTEWLDVIAAVRALYPGELTYAANYDSYSSVPFWDALDLIGIDAYWPLASSPTTSVAALRRAWSPHVKALSSFSATHNKPILFTEAGYTSQRGTTTAPYSWTLSTTPAPKEQAAAYKALLTTFTPHPWWHGVHFWMWDAFPNSEDPTPSLSYTPHKKPAEKLLPPYFQHPTRSP